MIPQKFQRTILSLRLNLEAMEYDRLRALFAGRGG